MNIPTLNLNILRSFMFRISIWYLVRFRVRFGFFGSRCWGPLRIFLDNRFGLGLGNSNWVQFGFSVLGFFAHLYYLDIYDVKPDRMSIFKAQTYYFGMFRGNFEAFSLYHIFRVGNVWTNSFVKRVQAQSSIFNNVS